MTQYAFLSLAEPPEARRARQVRLGLAFCLTFGISVAAGHLWGRYNPNELKDQSIDLIGGGVAAGVSVLLGDYSKAKAKTLRREFKLNIDSETISRERPPLKLSRGEVEAVYIGPFHSLRIVSTDSRRTIVVPGELEQRESALRDLLAIGLPLRSFSDWLADIALVRVAIAVTLGAAFISLWLPGPVWRLEIGSTVLLAGIIWDGVRVGGDPNVEYKYIGLERLLVVLAVLGVLWRDAHVLFDIWP
jgi:hypothetical protein